MESAERTNLAFDPFLDEVWGSEDSDTTPSIVRREEDPYWYLAYRSDNYDWNDAAWIAATRRGKNAWRAIPLWKRRPGSQGSRDVVPSGYFAAVSAKDYKRLTRHPDGTPKRWTLQAKYSEEDPERILKAYAIRHGRGEEPHTVMMHREVVGCLLRVSITEHYNGHGLDNRRENLAETCQSANMANARRERTRNSGLPVGVEMRRFKGEIRYGGIRAKRVPGKKHAKIFRTKRTWKTPEPAARWYQNQLKKMYGVRPWIHTPSSVSYPLFPPRAESEPVPPSRKARRKERELADIPF